MFDTTLIILDIFFPYIRFPFFLMIAIISALSIYLILNIKTTFHRTHYTAIIGVLLLCVFQAIPVSESRKNEQLEKAEKLLQAVESDKNYTKNVQELSIKLRKNTNVMLKKGYLNFANIYTITSIRHDLKMAVSKNQQFNPMVGIKHESIEPSVQPITQSHKTHSKTKHIVLKEVPVIQAEEEIEIQSASEAIVQDQISTEQIHQIIEESLDPPLVHTDELEENSP